MIGTDENRAVLHVEVIFWSGKRKIPPSLVSGKYCPHFVVTGTTEYLGVCFLDGTECTFDTPALGNAQPLYPDTIDYAPLENNAEFLIYEGANAVGKGRVLGRTVPYQVKQQRKILNRRTGKSSVPESLWETMMRLSSVIPSLSVSQSLMRGRKP